jgi:hypothetical protein
MKKWKERIEIVDSNTYPKLTDVKIVCFFGNEDRNLRNGIELTQWGQTHVSYENVESNRIDFSCLLWNNPFHIRKIKAYFDQAHTQKQIQEWVKENL